MHGSDNLPALDDVPQVLPSRQSYQAHKKQTFIGTNGEFI